jgi:hypothetical protein
MNQVVARVAAFQHLICTLCGKSADAITIIICNATMLSMQCSKTLLHMDRRIFWSYTLYIHRFAPVTRMVLE